MRLGIRPTTTDREDASKMVCGRYTEARTVTWPGMAKLMVIREALKPPELVRMFKIGWLHDRLDWAVAKMISTSVSTLVWDF